MKTIIKPGFVFLITLIVMACNSRNPRTNDSNMPGRTNDSIVELSLPLTLDKNTVAKMSGSYTRANLPAKHSIQSVIVKYKDLNNPVVKLVTFQPDSTDQIILYNIEKVPGKDNQEIVTQSQIDRDYRINVTKHLNNNLIESLFYEIDNNGNFIEIRDGKTPVTAFESFDNETYYIENFIWKPLPNGGIEKSDLTKKTLKVNEDGSIMEVKPSTR